MSKNLGSETLSKILARRRWTQREASQELGLGIQGQQALSAWLAGRIPRLRYAVILRDQLGIPVEAWLQPARKRSDPPPSRAA